MDVPLPSSAQNDNNSSSRLPSMADLLLQGITFNFSLKFYAFVAGSFRPFDDNLLCAGCSELLQEDEHENEGLEKTPMFKTGLGRFVPVKKSSIAKALSVLGDDSATDTGFFHSFSFIFWFLQIVCDCLTH